MPKSTLSFVQRLWAKVDADGDCWMWTASTNAYGYGQINRRGAPVLAHRIVWELLVGPIPDGLVIDHLCRNPPCVNPDHLEPVTQAENVRRGMSGNYLRAKTHCPQGHPYSGDNLYVEPRTGRRRCRICMRDTSRRFKAKGRASSAV